MIARAVLAPVAALLLVVCAALGVAVSGKTGGAYGNTLRVVALPDGETAELGPIADEVERWARRAKRTPGRVRPDGSAVAPPGAARAVRAIVAGANAIARTPYRYGGGHGAFADAAYDCSGSISYALHRAGLLETPLASGGLARWGEPGPGRWVTIYANGSHAFMVVAGMRFDTSGRGARGTRWTAFGRPTAGFVARHPAGL